jgi:type II secretory pathway pseudopilin PulG
MTSPCPPVCDRQGFEARSEPRAFTLIEVLVTVSSLIIILGLMASLARYVRRQASDKQTKLLLVTLTGLMEKYVARHDRMPDVTPLLPPAPATGPGSPVVPSSDTLPDESELREAARINNREFTRALRKEAGPGVDIFGPAAGAPNEERVLDAWGRDVVFMPRGHPAIGTALQDHPFFFSAGPDGRYRTLEDNLYSYEIPGVERGGD